ncbi:hypothetical protein [Candidatus Xianfuyuplasma coldseepsis]|uniref:Transmembrane protein n=1 Tax=Candidatus Xianfuyuplasma coldseepsis TaxID=2782163 RepID=A0A7L7KS00_9MOLU|nr:hypothetical protein [Xianfuyuplasma coldseepsis]QMS85375.1 hypothetical protein G4Z02_06285 [Xianfuyuplasma coldseepsis]
MRRSHLLLSKGLLFLLWVFATFLPILKVEEELVQDEWYFVYFDHIVLLPQSMIFLVIVLIGCIVIALDFWLPVLSKIILLVIVVEWFIFIREMTAVVAHELHEEFYADVGKAFGFYAVLLFPILAVTVSFLQPYKRHKKS